MRLPAISLLAVLAACDAASPTSYRDGSTSETSSACEPPPEPTLPSTAKCECDEEADCGPGTDCVPVDGKGRCLAPYSDIFCVLRGQGWDGVTILGIYPFQTADDLGPAYCPVCQTCEPPAPGFLLCQ